MFKNSNFTQNYFLLFKQSEEPRPKTYWGVAVNKLAVSNSSAFEDCHRTVATLWSQDYSLTSFSSPLTAQGLPVEDWLLLT